MKNDGNFVVSIKSYGWELHSIDTGIEYSQKEYIDTTTELSYGKFTEGFAVFEVPIDIKDSEFRYDPPGCGIEMTIDRTLLE